MKSPRVEIESSMKIINIPKLQFPLDSSKETKSPEWQEYIQETFHSPVPNQEINLHQMHEVSAMVSPSSKLYNGIPRDKFTSDHFGTLTIPYFI